MRHTVSVVLVLAVIWLLNSGHYGVLHLGLGVFSVLLVTCIALRMDVVDHESPPIHLTPRLFPYYYWLLKKVVISNLDVVRRVWSRNPDISPQIGYVPADQVTDMGRVIYANSITLTPGTVSIELEDDRILVHALTAEGFEEVRGGEMNRRVLETES